MSGKGTGQTRLSSFAPDVPATRSTFRSGTVRTASARATSNAKRAASSADAMSTRAGGTCGQLQGATPSFSVNQRRTPMSGIDETTATAINDDAALVQREQANFDTAISGRVTNLQNRINATPPGDTAAIAADNAAIATLQALQTAIDALCVQAVADLQGEAAAA